MTGRDLLARKKRRAGALIIAGFGLFIGGSWLAHLNLIPVAPLLVMLFGGHFLALSLHCVQFFAFRCPRCARVWESHSSLRSLFEIDKRIRYCPFCGFDIDGPVGEDHGSLESDEGWRSIRLPEPPVPDFQRLVNESKNWQSEMRSRGIRGFLLVALIWLAVIGLVLSLIAHVCGSLGLPQPLGDATWGLHVGVFVVALSSIMASFHLPKGFQKKDLWDVVRRVCPTWMLLLAQGFGFYALTNFITFIALAPAVPPAPRVPAPPIVFQGFSGHWMAFYSLAVAYLYSALVMSKHGPMLCSGQHLISPRERFCEVCGTEGITLPWPDRLADAEDVDIAHHAREALEVLCEEMDQR